VGINKIVVWAENNLSILGKRASSEIWASAGPAALVAELLNVERVRVLAIHMANKAVDMLSKGALAAIDSLLAFMVDGTTGRAGLAANFAVDAQLLAGGKHSALW
jgi:hypothetical protein